ncbi:helix-turn-helix transcriptional regulator [Bacillus badius]|uniref:helix-turn-helix transcriptional regulator n=1 Tax=Bacillus badius TaxID=1455 RepID=UPI001CBAF2C3|nr:helix-turn-helix transcriptional regulator [Bacillus badius]UAT29969.1 helix-turn-helix transcriptional regulator [Bacillus badius]
MRNWLKELRLQKKLTHSEVAQKANIERSYYTMIEQGNRNPSVTVAKAIAKAIGFDWTIFFENQCNETKQTKNAI